MFSKRIPLALFGCVFVAACSVEPHVGDVFEPKSVTNTKRVGPYKQCFWDYENGLPQFRNSALDTKFDPRFDPVITVSRRGLTARVIGVFDSADLARFGGSVEDLARVYPYVVPVEYVAHHSVRAEDIRQSAAQRAQNPAGEIVSTRVERWPKNTAMIIYPVSIAAEGYNTVAGEWRVLAKARGAYNNRAGDFGLFPFLKYTARGHALHGPITGDAISDEWYLRRGKVSHGCNRMDGEHITELSVLLGCPASGKPHACAVGNERVTVVEDFDFLPDPRRRIHEEGHVVDPAEIARVFVVPDVTGYPRDGSYPMPEKWQRKSETPAVWLLKTELGSNGKAVAVPWAPILEFATWDNRTTSATSGFPIVVGRNCR